MEKTEQENETMNRGTYEALRSVGATEEQAVVLATAIPDLEVLRGDIERRINSQTRWIVGTMIAVGGLLVASNIVSSFFA